MQLGPVRHVCAFFDGDEEAYRTLLPFIADGFACGHKAVHVVRQDREADHLRRLAAQGIDVAAARATGALEVRRDTDTYLPGGRFDGERMLAAFEAMASGNADGFPLSRIVCDMAWVAGEPRAREEVITFEARVNEVWDRHDDVVVCVYDVRTLSGAMVTDIVRTHPLVLIGGALQENPFFVPPAQFLRERAETPSPVPAVS
jgi:hypothetical protein